MRSHLTKPHHSYNHPDLGHTPAIHEVTDPGPEVPRHHGNEPLEIRNNKGVCLGTRLEIEHCGRTIWTKEDDITHGS